MKDWRGVELAVGQTVIYGAGVSRSISPVVATVIALLPGKDRDREAGRDWATDDKVRLEIQEYAYGYRSDVTKPVPVMAARVTVVEGVPTPQEPTVCPGCREAKGPRQRDEDGNCRHCAWEAKRKAEA